MTNLFLIAAAILIAVVCELLLKNEMNKFGILRLELSTIPQTLLRLLTNPVVLCGLMLYGVTAFLWLAVLSRVDLSYAYPMWALSYVVVTLAARFVLQEPVSAWRYVGLTLVCLGVVVMART